jgi:hypothetical protein
MQRLNQLMEFWHDAILDFIDVFWLLMTCYFYFFSIMVFYLCHGPFISESYQEGDIRQKLD